jgi:flagellar basal body-associated protein FliL
MEFYNNPIYLPENQPGKKPQKKSNFWTILLAAIIGGLIGAAALGVFLFSSFSGRINPLLFLMKQYKPIQNYISDLKADLKKVSENPAEVVTSYSKC